MYNGNADGGNGTGYPVQPHAALDAPEEQYPDRDDDAYTGGLAAQDINAQHYTQQYAVNIPDDDQLTYGEGRTYQHSTSFSDYPPHTLVSTRCHCHALCQGGTMEHFLRHCINKSRFAIQYLMSKLHPFKQDPAILLCRARILMSLHRIRAAKYTLNHCLVIPAQTILQLFLLLQPHPASDQAAASVVASGAQTTIQLPRVHFPDDGAQDVTHTYGDDWHDEPLSPVTTVYGEPPPPTLARQQTFGRVGAY